MPTFTYDERVKVAKAMETAGACACPRCGSPLGVHRLQTTQDKLLKKPGKPLYRCPNPKCMCECTPLTYMTIAPNGGANGAGAEGGKPGPGSKPPA